MDPCLSNGKLTCTSATLEEETVREQVLTPPVVSVISLERLASSSEAMSTALRMIDFYTIPRTQGDCVVLLLVHPGLNSLGRYFPP